MTDLLDDVKPGVRLERRNGTPYDGPDRRVKQDRETRYMDAATWVETLLDSLCNEFKFGRVDTDIRGNVVRMNARAQHLTGTQHFKGEFVPLRNVVPSHVSSPHDGWWSRWVRSPDIVRPLADSAEMRVEDHKTGEMRTVRILLMRPPSEEIVASALVLEQEQIEHAIEGNGFERRAGALTNSFVMLLTTAHQHLAGALIVMFSLIILCASVIIPFGYAFGVAAGGWFAPDDPLPQSRYYDRRGSEIELREPAAEREEREVRDPRQE